MPHPRTYHPLTPLPPESSHDEPWAEEELTVANAILASGLHGLRHLTVNIEKESTEGAAILMPQVARSMGWHNEVAVLVVTSFAFQILQFVAALSIVAYIDRGEQVMDIFGGQPYLCDFGVEIDACVGSTEPFCAGPAGTTTTAKRLYSFTAWSVRKFVRDSLRALLPDRIDEVNDLVDPGEYGVESYWCRLMCCALFVLSVYQEVQYVWHLICLLWFLPNQNEPWVVPKESLQGEKTNGSSKEWAVNGFNWQDHIEVKVAGMSPRWKIWNIFFILFPKTVLVCLTMTAGIDYLMDTSNIDDMIVNTVALDFILGIDTLVVQSLMSKQSQALLEMCQPKIVVSTGENWYLSKAQVVKLFKETRGTWRGFFRDLMFRKLCSIYLLLILTGGLVLSYYIRHCEFKDGRWISRAMYYPLSTRYTLLNLLLPDYFPLQTEPEAFWDGPHPS